ncbi:hypothetical protein F4777DRAFT_231648 [Nemania sp. FL0916]|nr:hypothetical protein F4777DRAFT_231648 [Nemania sp. FL0916]
MTSQPLFGLLPAGQPLVTIPTSQPNATSFLYLLPSTTPSNPKPFAHLAVFLLPGITLPENSAAAIYLARNPSAFAQGGAGSAAADFTFLGGVGPGKESAVFKLGPSSAGAGDGGVVIGIDIEGAAGVAERIQQLQLQAQSNSQSQSQSTALVPVNQKQQQQPSPLLLAQRIIQNAFNFLSGFSGQVGSGPDGGVEVVPLRAFQEWWRKFETKIKNDPSFLERPQD